jgi:hypothetical protein
MGTSEPTMVQPFCGAWVTSAQGRFLMDELIALARRSSDGEAARVELLKRLNSVRKQDAFRKAILKKATDEQRRIAEFARSYSGSDFLVLCNIAARYTAE